MNNDAQMTSVAIQEKTIRLARGLTAAPFDAGGGDPPKRHKPIEAVEQEDEEVS